MYMNALWGTRLIWLKVTLGIYGPMLQALPSWVGLFGAVPCCPYPDPFPGIK